MDDLTAAVRAIKIATESGFKSIDSFTVREFVVNGVYVGHVVTILGTVTDASPRPRLHTEKTQIMIQDEP